MNNLHLGAGNVYIAGWTNVDLFSNVQSDVYSSVLSLPFDRESFDLIYACHVLEHLNRHLILSALTHWRDLLKPGGTLRLSVPNFQRICEHYTRYKNIKEITGLLYGGQKFHLDCHNIAFDYETLVDYLRMVGFTEYPKIWDWKETEHSQYDDYSQAYLPHRDKENGMLMSLNVQVKK